MFQINFTWTVQIEGSGWYLWNSVVVVAMSILSLMKSYACSNATIKKWTYHYWKARQTPYSLICIELAISSWRTYITKQFLYNFFWISRTRIFCKLFYTSRRITFLPYWLMRLLWAFSISNWTLFHLCCPIIRVKFLHQT